MMRYGRRDSRQWVFSRHALHRMEEMGVEREEVLRVALDAEVTYTGRRTVAQRGALAVVYVAEGTSFVVITVLWRTQEQWKRPA